MSNSALAKMTEATVKVTGRRYCTTHRGEVAAEAGSHVPCQKQLRWVCFNCQEKRSAALSKR